MQHIHLHTCASTQSYLRENLDELLTKNTDILVSTENQTSGYGRQEKNWQQYSGSIAFSFTLAQHKISTLTSIEIGLLAIRYLNSEFDSNLKIKWPNDILNSRGEKIGGIICHTHNKLKVLIAGVGINFVHREKIKEGHDFPASQIENSLGLQELETLPLKIYEYILNNRLESKNLFQDFDKYNFFHNKNVKMTDSKLQVTGIFKGLNEFGLALIEDSDSTIHQFLSGTLREA